MSNIKLSTNQFNALEAIYKSTVAKVNAKTAKALQDKGLIKPEKDWFSLTDQGKRELGVFYFPEEVEAREAKAKAEQSLNTIQGVT